MEDERTIMERILEGEANLSDCDLDSDFDDSELLELLDNGIITLRDISDWRASDLVISGLLSYDEYPFERFSNYEKVRQLEQNAISREDFRAKAELESFDGDDWLALLGVWPEMDAEAPWDMIRSEARADQWIDFLSIRPECAEKADWKRIFEQGKPEEYFKMLVKQPALYGSCPDKTKLLEADPAYWVELIIRQPEFARIYPMKDLDKADEVEHLLLHRPELTGMLTWDKDDPPVKLYITNNMPDGMKRFFPDSAWFVSTEKTPVIQNILQTVLFHGKQDAERLANVIAHDCVTFAGVYSTRAAEDIMKKFEATVTESKLPLSIRKEDNDGKNHKFTPKDELEKAILKQQNRKIIQLTVEANSLTASRIHSWYRPDRGYGLKRPNILATEEFLSLPVRTAAVVCECAMNCCLRQWAQRFLDSDSEVNDLLNEVEATGKLKPSAAEEKLVSTILAGDSQKVCRLIEKEKICLRSMTQESMTALCCALKKLDPYTVVLLFAAGIHDASAAVLLKFLLRACERESVLNGMDYKERLMYANLLIHILQGDITPEDDDLIYEDWFPMGNSIKDGCDQRVSCHPYSYYFDPQHLYEPRFADGEYEKPEHSIR